MTDGELSPAHQKWNAQMAAVNSLFERNLEKDLAMVTDLVPRLSTIKCA